VTGDGDHAFTRRAWLRATGAGALAAWLGEGCGDNVVPGLAATLEVDGAGAVIAVFSPAAGAASVEIVDAATGAIAARARAELGDGGTARLDVDGLRADTRYVYRVELDDGSVTDQLSFTTAPTTARPVRLAYGADLDLDPRWASPILDSLTAAAAEVYVSIGDWPYADGASGATTLEAYRQRHLDVRQPDSVRRWLRTCSVRAIYDDHEVCNDWDATTRTDEPARVAAALQAWDEWFPVRGAPTGARYRTWSWGPLVDIFLLDCRRYRDAHGAADGPAKTMLGSAQRAWLLDGLAASRAPFKLVFTSVPLDYGYPGDHWSSYAHERDLILDAIRDAALPGVLFLTADQHWFAAHVHRGGAREFQVGPLARGLPELPPARPGVLVQVRTYNYGLIDVVPGVDQAPPRLTFTCQDQDGAQVYQEAFTPDDLRLR
jgi:alkaline phosphatase D